jgi:hypothetical protein
MLDHMWEREREREREREMGLWEKKREVEEVSWFRSFILVFTDKITDRQLNIKICNISVSDSVYKVKWKFLTCTKTLKKPLQILLMTFHFINDFVRKKSE